MTLKSLEITLQEDGFSIVDGRHAMAEGTPLLVQYELSNGWIRKNIEFEITSHATLLHPFRKPTMFVYTGEAPRRVIVQPRPVFVRGQWGVKTARQNFDAGTYYDDRDFCSYPLWNNGVWMDDDYRPYCLGIVFQNPRIDPEFAFDDGGVGAGGADDSAPMPPPYDAADAGTPCDPDAPQADVSAKSEDNGEVLADPGMPQDPNAYDTMLA